MFAGYGILCGQLFSFSTSTLIMLLHCLLSCIVLTRSLQCYFVVILSNCLYAQLCLILCNPMDCSPPGSFFHGISRQEHWSGLPYPPLGNLPDSGIESVPLASPALAGGFFTTEPPRN